MKRRILALCLLLSCGRPGPQAPARPELDVHADAGFAPLERAAILDATLDLVAHGVRVRLQFDADMWDGKHLADQASGFLLLRGSAMSDLVETVDAQRPGFRVLGFVSQDGRRAWVLPERAGSRLTHVAAHELGHMAGLVHEDEGLMAAITPAGWVVSFY